jgi:hypothetical protein
MARMWQAQQHLYRGGASSKRQAKSIQKTDDYFLSERKYKQYN